MSPQSDRRSFLKTSGLLACASTLLPQGCLRLGRAGADDGCLRGFIVSDAHFGWEHEQQPAPEHQARAMATICRRFPELDVFIDTGDAHHAIASREKGDAARGLWTDIIPGGCPPIPFFYIAGNHEIMPVQGLDPEMRCNRLGSVSCRPYYSFDLRNVHFVSVPELQHPVLVSRETLEWLRLDLDLNRDRTVILLSHNHILGTTFRLQCPTVNTDLHGYRGLVNSDQLLEIIREHPNVLAWMHGHNHNYEVVKAFGRLFVSNGRIGGFNPPEKWGDMGQGHLGGVYFEVRPEGLKVRCYSADADAFFDELGSPGLSGEIETPTSVDPRAPASYAYGSGGACAGEMLPVVHHHAGTGPRELVMTGADGPLVNDDPAFTLYTKREHTVLGNQWILPSASVGYPKYFEKTNDLWEWTDPGIRLLAQDAPGKVVDVCIPHHHYGPFVYYRVAPGRVYEAVVDLDSGDGGQSLQLEFLVHDRSGNRVLQQPMPEQTLAPGRQEIRASVRIPVPDGQPTIYTDPEQSDNVLQLMVKAHFSGLADPLVISLFGMRAAGGGSRTLNPSLSVDDLRLAHTGTPAPGEPARSRGPAPTAARSVVRLEADGNARLTWLVRHCELDWQVRNAPVADGGSWLEVGPLRNVWGTRREIILVPMARTRQAFVHRFTGVSRARVFPLNRGNPALRIDVLELLADSASVEVRGAPRSCTVQGAKDWTWTPESLLIRLQGPGEITVDC